MRRRTLLVVLPLARAGCPKSEPPPPPPPPAPAAPKVESVEIEPALLLAFKALPDKFEATKNPSTEAKVNLGRQLYFETRLSKNQDLACESCHHLAAYGVDGQKTSPGHKKQLGNRNSPTVYNAAGHFAQFWDGRAADVEEQAKGPVTNPVEMAMPSEKRVVEVLRSIPGYVEAFKQAFPGEKDPISMDRMAMAIAAFERQLVTPSRFDKFLGGDKNALTNDEKRGLKKFVEVGCMSCHMGVNVGGGMYQKLGLVVPYPDQKDAGRFEVTKQEADRMFFRVPTLRNVDKTAPYFHDGSVADLSQAVKLMARHQLGKEVSDDDTQLIVAFLRSLTGELPKALIEKPALPASGPKTPKPDPT